LDWLYFPGHFSSIVEFRRLPIDDAFGAGHSAVDAPRAAVDKEFRLGRL